ncbi:MAG: Virion structural protein [uncultured bacterium]|nr:MAG: Virion structural protein [uncultured bacterium]
MAGNSVNFACTSLAGVNKVGNLKQDENGYYPMIVGALNVFNSAGQFYVFEQAKELFNQSSQLMRRVSRGALRGEYGHPKPLPGMSDDQFANRVMSIYEENTCCHHKEITLDFDNVKDANGKPIIAIISKVCPSGPFGPALEKSLKNKDENVCFSIRAFTDDYRDKGITKRVLKTIVTWDLVNEPGLAIAEKFKSPALESFDDVDGKIITRGEIERGMDSASMRGLATESAILTADELFLSMGWSAPAGSSIQRPSYVAW